MQFIFLAAMLVSLGIVLFAVQNAAPVMINFLMWRFEGSLALLLIVAFCCGALASALFAIPFRLKKRHVIDAKEQRIRDLEDALVEYKRVMNPLDPLN